VWYIAAYFEHRTGIAELNSFVTCLRFLRQSEYWAPDLSVAKRN
jgi:hypothetical protein